MRDPWAGMVQGNQDKFGSGERVGDGFSKLVLCPEKNIDGLKTHAA